MRTTALIREPTNFSAETSFYTRPLAVNVRCGACVRRAAPTIAGTRGARTGERCPNEMSEETDSVALASAVGGEPRDDRSDGAARRCGAPRRWRARAPGFVRARVGHGPRATRCPRARRDHVRMAGGRVAVLFSRLADFTPIRITELAESARRQADRPGDRLEPRARGEAARHRGARGRDPGSADRRHRHEGRAWVRHAAPGASRTSARSSSSTTDREMQALVDDPRTACRPRRSSASPCDARASASASRGRNVDTLALRAAGAAMGHLGTCPGVEALGEPASPSSLRRRKGRAGQNGIENARLPRRALPKRLVWNR